MRVLSLCVWLLSNVAITDNNDKAVQKQVAHHFQLLRSCNLVLCYVGTHGDGLPALTPRGLESRCSRRFVTLLFCGLGHRLGFNSAGPALARASLGRLWSDARCDSDAFSLRSAFARLTLFFFSGDATCILYI